MEQPFGAEPSRSPAAAPQGGARAAAGFLSLAALAAVAGSALVASAPDSPNAMLLATLLAEVLFACLAFGGTRLAGRALRRGLRLERPSLGVGELAALAVGFVCLSQALSLALAGFSLRDTGTLAEIDRVVAQAEGPSRGLAFVALGLAPAFGEELLFRGLIQQTARPRLGLVGAIALASVGFGAIHADAVQSPAAVVLGIYLGIVVELGGGLWAAILCHAINNSLAVVGPQLGMKLAPAALWTLAAAFSTSAAVLLGWVVRRALVRRRAGSGPLGATTDSGVG